MWEKQNCQTLSGYFLSGASRNPLGKCFLTLCNWSQWFKIKKTRFKHKLKWGRNSPDKMQLFVFYPQRLVDIKPCNFSSRWLPSASHSDRQQTLCILHGRDVLGGIKTAWKKTCLYNIICKCPLLWRLTESIAPGRCGMQRRKCYYFSFEHSWGCSISKFCTRKKKKKKERKRKKKNHREARKNNDTLAAYGETWI